MKIKAQSTIEFTFAVIATMFIIYSMVQVFRWAGMDLANRRVTQDSAMITPVVINNDNPSGDPLVQLNADTGGALPMAAVYHGSITNGNASQ